MSFSASESAPISIDQRTMAQSSAQVTTAIGLMNEDSHTASQAEERWISKLNWWEGPPKNTPYLLLPFLDIQLLRLIAEMLGPRCYCCNEAIAVLGRIDGHWEWSCLDCKLEVRESLVNGSQEKKKEEEEETESGMETEEKGTKKEKEKKKEVESQDKKEEEEEQDEEEEEEIEKGTLETEEKGTKKDKEKKKEEKAAKKEKKQKKKKKEKKVAKKEKNLKKDHKTAKKKDKKEKKDKK